MTNDELKKRAKKFALSVIFLAEKLPNTPIGRTICNQIIRSATSVGANYRAACRARRRSDFISKITIVEVEFDETLYWLEIIAESGLIESEIVEKKIDEANELTAIFTASGKTARQNNLKYKSIKS